MKKTSKPFLKQSLLAAIAISCISFVSACQQPEPPQSSATPATTASPTTSPTSTPSASSSLSASPSASPTETSKSTKGTPVTSLDKVAGEYTVVLDPKVLADAEKDGVKSVTGKWTIKPEGTFEATLKAVSVKGEEQQIKTTGKITLEDGKVVSQVESVNGETPPKAPPKQPYTMSADGKELQADGQPVKLVKQ